MSSSLLMARARINHKSPMSSLFNSGARGFWYNVQDLSTLWTDIAGTAAAVENSYVARIDDKSGNGHHLTQSSSDKRPQLLKDSNGKYYLKFSGGQSLFRSSTTALALRTDSLLLGVAGSMSTVNSSFVSHSIAASAVGRYSILAESTYVRTLLDFEGVGDLKAVSTYSPSSTVRSFLMSANRSSGDYKLEIDGTSFSGPSVINSVNITNTYKLRLGAYGDSSDSGDILYLNGRIYSAVLLFGPVTSDNKTIIKTEFSKFT